MEEIWRNSKVRKRNGRFSHNEYLAMWKDYPIEEATWETKSNFLDDTILQHNLIEGQPAEVEPRKL